MTKNNGHGVDEGDKLEIEGEDGVYVVTWSSSLSVKAEPAGDTFGLSERVKWSGDELETDIQNGDVTVLNDDEPVTDAGRAIHDHVDMDELMDRLEGRGGGLRSSKPDTDADNGLIKYVWRRARFHSGHDTSMPVMANTHLQNYLDANGLDASVTGVMDDAGKEITTELEKAVDAVIVGFDENPAMAANRWKKAGAF